MIARPQNYEKRRFCVCGSASANQQRPNSSDLENNIGRLARTRRRDVSEASTVDARHRPHEMFLWYSRIIRLGGARSAILSDQEIVGMEKITGIRRMKIAGRHCRIPFE